MNIKKQIPKFIQDKINAQKQPNWKIHAGILTIVVLIQVSFLFGHLTSAFTSKTFIFTNTVHAKNITEVPLEVEVKKGRINEITMYTSMPIQTDSTPCIGADGQDVCVLWKKGQNICATNAYPLGTEIHIDKLGDCLVTDRMNSRYKQRIDWYAGYDEDCLDNFQAGDNCPNYNRAIKFGLQNLYIYVK